MLSCLYVSKFLCNFIVKKWKGFVQLYVVNYRLAFSYLAYQEVLDQHYHLLLVEGLKQITVCVFGVIYTEHFWSIEVEAHISALTEWKLVAHQRIVYPHFVSHLSQPQSIIRSQGSNQRQEGVNFYVNIHPKIRHFLEYASQPWQPHSKFLLPFHIPSFEEVWCQRNVSLSIKLYLLK